MDYFFRQSVERKAFFFVVQICIVKWLLVFSHLCCTVGQDTNVIFRKFKSFDFSYFGDFCQKIGQNGENFAKSDFRKSVFWTCPNVCCNTKLFLILRPCQQPFNKSAATVKYLRIRSLHFVLKLLHWKPYKCEELQIRHD